ncbi:MAG: hypothetical protein QG599_109 [Pseudomonadota bacterium]|nr:hypothetical protein [Pseudomonadota bacterium]
MMLSEVTFGRTRYKLCATGLATISIHGISLTMIIPGKQSVSAFDEFALFNMDAAAVWTHCGIFSTEFGSPVNMLVLVLILSHGIHIAPHFHYMALQPLTTIS